MLALGLSLFVCGLLALVAWLEQWLLSPQALIDVSVRKSRHEVAEAIVTREADRILRASLASD